MSKKGMIRVQSNGRSHKKSSAKRRKGENSPVVRLLPGSHERLASGNPRVLCQNYGGACTTYQLGVPMVQETGQEIGFPRSRERRKQISK